MMFNKFHFFLNSKKNSLKQNISAFICFRFVCKRKLNKAVTTRTVLYCATFLICVCSERHRNFSNDANSVRF